MQEKLRNKFPAWVDQQGDNVLCLSHDLDSLISTKLLAQAFGWRTNYFCDFKNLYVFDGEDDRQTIGVDMALCKGKTYCNHVTRLYGMDEPNPESANVNNIMRVHAGSKSSYTNKFSMSTALLIYSLYDIPLPSTNLGKQLLLCVDSAWQGYYRFPAAYKRWLDLLDLQDLENVLQGRSREDWRQLEQQYGMFEPIAVEDGRLVTKLDLDRIGKILGIELTLPRGHLTSIKQFNLHYMDRKEYLKRTKGLDFKPFSLAATSMDRVAFSTVKRRCD